MHGLYKSYKGLEVRVESHSANHRPSRLGHVGAHDELWLDGDWASDTFFSVTDRQKRDYLSRALQRARGATKNIENITQSSELQQTEAINLNVSLEGKQVDMLPVAAVKSY